MTVMHGGILAMSALLVTGGCARSDLFGLELDDGIVFETKDEIPIAPGDECTDGGVASVRGYDFDQDGELAGDEVRERIVRCFADTNGTAGPGSLVRIEGEPAGERCPSGGQAILTGRDIDADGVLSPSEVEQTAYVCNGLAGDLDPNLCEVGPILDGTFSVARAAELAQLRGVVCIRGHLLIVGADVTSLRPLAALRQVSGDLVISTNARLGTLEGLDSLVRVDGSFSILNNLTLATLEGMRALEQVGTRLAIIGNPALRSLGGLALLDHLAGTLEISGNSGLTALGGLEALVRASHDVLINNNNSLVDLDALSRLGRIDGSLSFVGNDRLSSISLPIQRVDGRIDVFESEHLAAIDLPNLTLVGSIRIHDDPALTTLSVPFVESLSGRLELHSNHVLREVLLPAAIYIGEALRFFDNSLIAVIDLTSLTTVGGELYFRANDALLSFEGLRSLRVVSGNMTIIDNDQLQSCRGLVEFRSVSGNMLADGNAALASFDGLERFSLVGGNLVLTNNPALAMSVAQAFSERVMVGGTVQISGNGPG